MEVEEILKRLDLWDEGIPAKLLDEAVARRSEVTPGLIAAINEVAENPAVFRDHPDRNLYYWAVYLLTHFEEKSAFPAILRLFDLNRTEFAPLVSDIIEEDGAMILANVCAGDIEPICRMLHDKTAPEPNRFAAADALGFLCAWGTLDSARVEQEFRAALAALEPNDVFLGSELMNVASDLNLRELAPDIARAFHRGVIDRDDFEFVAEWLHDPDFEPPPPFMHMVQAIDDIVDFFEAKLEEERLLEENPPDEDV